MDEALSFKAQGQRGKATGHSFSPGKWHNLGTQRKARDNSFCFSNHFSLALELSVIEFSKTTI